MTVRRRLTLAAAAAIALAGGGAAIVQASGDDGEGDATGPQAEQATSAALKITGGGKANSVERDGENGATWEVEITKPDRRTVDVRLDADYELVIVEGDTEDANGE